MISIPFFLKLTGIPIRRWHPLQILFIRESVITLMTVINSRPPETPTNGIVSNKNHDDVIKWKHFFPRYWPCVRGIHRSLVNSLHKGQWRGTLMFFLICAWINSWVNNREAGDLRRNRAHYGVTVMSKHSPNPSNYTLNNSNPEYLQNA